MPRFLVAHPHKGWDGTRRTPGEVVTLSTEEAAVRVRDGFGRLVTEPYDQGGTLPSGVSVVTNTTGEPIPVRDADDAEAAESAAAPPKMSAPKAAWLEFLAEQGHDRQKLEGMSRGELIALAQARE